MSSAFGFLRWWWWGVYLELLNLVLACCSIRKVLQYNIWTSLLYARIVIVSIDGEVS